MSDLQNTNIKNQAIKMALSGDWSSAIELNKTLLEENPKDIESLNRLALAFTITGKLDDAQKMYDKVFEIDPLNPIALKNSRRLKDKSGLPENTNDFQINSNFLEETGKTKIIELVNLAQSSVIQTLRVGQCVGLSIKRSKIFVIEGEKQYIGVLPDDIGGRLIKFIKSGNKYDACVKSTTGNKVFVFIKETKRASKFKNHPSFTSISDNGLGLDKIKIKSKSLREDDDFEDSHSED
jgi:tetratricopeptide (TPR) repeat protein